MKVKWFFKRVSSVLAFGFALAVFPLNVFAANPGALVTDFGDDGMIAIETGNDLTYAGDIAIDASGRIYAVVYAYDPVQPPLGFVYRLDQGGVPDTSFS